jgi:hypothetical protein
MPDFVSELMTLVHAHPLVGAGAAIGAILYAHLMMSGPRTP